MKKLYHEIRLRTRYIWCGIRTMFQPHLMDYVIYKGKRYFINNGIHAPFWDLIEAVPYYEGRKSILVHENDFKKEKTIKNYLGSIKRLYQFHMDYWHSIHMRKAIGDEMYGRTQLRTNS